MIITWMLAAVLFTLCVGIAATAVERLMRAYGRAARGAWIAALAVAVTWPVLVPLMGSFAAPIAMDTSSTITAPSVSADNALVITPDEASTVWSRVSAITQQVSAQTRRLSYVMRSNASWLDPIALAVWGLLTGVLLLRLMIAVLHVRRLTKHATPSVVDGSEVLLADGFGPATVGWRTPRVVVPQWVLSLDTPLRALVLRHETEHCRTRDPRFVWCAAMATALMPWNAGLWWLSRRLRLALELDCDVRTLRHGGDPRTYAKLLLFMTQQHAAPAAHLRLASSLAASRSHLATRIKAMQENSRLMSRGARLAAVGVGALAVIGASATRIPDTLVAPDAPLPQAPAVSVVAMDTSVRVTASEKNSAPIGAPDVAVTTAPMSAPVEAPRTVSITPSSTAPAAASDTPIARDTIYFEFQVEKPAAMRAGSNRMVYPELLRSAGVEGVVLVSFVVDEAGAADMNTFKVLKSDHELFTAAVRTALPNIGYLPAEINRQKVKQLVQQPFVFSLARRDADRAVNADIANAAAAKRPSAVVVTAIAGSATPATIGVPRTVPGSPADASASTEQYADTYFESQVEKPAAMRPGPLKMEYPVMLRSAQVEGTVIASFVVDELGVPDMSTFKVLRSDHGLFTQAVRAALPELRYLPAEVGNKKVKQLVQQPFVFSLPR